MNKAIILVCLIVFSTHSNANVYGLNCPQSNPSVSWHSYFTGKVPPRMVVLNPTYGTDTPQVPRAMVVFDRLPRYPAPLQLDWGLCYNVSYHSNVNKWDTYYFTPPGFELEFIKSYGNKGDANNYEINIFGELLHYNDYGEVLDKRGTPIGSMSCHIRAMDCQKYDRSLPYGGTIERDMLQYTNNHFEDLVKSSLKDDFSYESVFNQIYHLFNTVPTYWSQFVPMHDSLASRSWFMDYERNDRVKIEEGLKRHYADFIASYIYGNLTHRRMKTGDDWRAWYDSINRFTEFGEEHRLEDWHYNRGRRNWFDDHPHRSIKSISAEMRHIQKEEYAQQVFLDQFRHDPPKSHFAFDYKIVTESIANPDDTYTIHFSIAVILFTSGIWIHNILADDMMLTEDFWTKRIKDVLYRHTENERLNIEGYLSEVNETILSKFSK